MRRALLSLLLLTAAGPALAEGTPPPDPALVAQAAAAVVDEHCSEAAAGTATESALAVAAVSSVLADVSAAHDASGEAWLLYWRGVLQQCIDREERAIDDLRAFLESADPGRVYASQRADARRRLVRLDPGSGGDRAPRSALGFVLAGGLAGGGAIFGGISSAEAQLAASREQSYRVGLRPWAETAQLYSDAEQANQAANALLGGAVGFGVGGVTAAVVSAVLAGRAAKVTVSASVVPTSGGVAVAFFGEW